MTTTTPLPSGIAGLPGAVDGYATAPVCPPEGAMVAEGSTLKCRRLVIVNKDVPPTAFFAAICLKKGDSIIFVPGS
jgi:hypothetical protein